MNNVDENKFDTLCRLIQDSYGPIHFTILEIGALPIEGCNEPFHRLLEIFPGSTIIAFEIDKKLCENLNKKPTPGLKYYPVALGRTEETRDFFETNHPMCSSLYQPNEELLKLYHNMRVAMTKSAYNVKPR